MMVKHMPDTDIKGKTVPDVGCGSDILSILAERLGAKQVQAIDIDDRKIQNARENTELNNCVHIDVEKADVFSSTHISYDIILANYKLQRVFE